MLSSPQKEKALHVLFLPSWYPSRVHNTAGIFIKRHAVAAALYCNVSILYIVCDPRLLGRTYDVDVTYEDGLYTVRAYYRQVTLNIPLLTPLWKAWRFLAAAYKGYWFVRQKGKPDLLHINVILKSGIPALLIHYLQSIPLVITEHWTGYHREDGKYRGWLVKFFTRIIVNNARSVITVSHHLRTGMLQHGLKNDYDVIYNTVNTSVFRLPEKKNNSAKKYILHVSTLIDEHKNITGILNVTEQLARVRNDFELHIISDNEDIDDFHRQLRQRGLKDKVVFFHGPQNEEQVAAWMQRAAFLLLFSNYENSPCVLTEALACGIPVVASVTGGIPEFIRPEHGILVPVKDEAALIKAITHLLDHDNLYDSLALHEYVKNNFSYPVIGQQLFAIYQKALSKMPRKK